MLCVGQNTEERGLGKAQLDACGVHKSPLRFWLWACSTQMVPGTGDVFQ